MVKEHNFAPPGNAGPVFFLDVLAPLYLIVLYAIVVSMNEPARRRARDRCSGTSG